MIITKRKPAPVAEMLVEEFMKPLGLTQTALARAMGVERRLVHELCNGRRTVTVDTALMLARVFGNTPEFWLNVQRRAELWEALNTPARRRRIARARPLERAARWRGNDPFAMFGERGGKSDRRAYRRS